AVPPSAVVAQPQPSGPSASSPVVPLFLPATEEQVTSVRNILTAIADNRVLLHRKKVSAVVLKEGIALGKNDMTLMQFIDAAFVNEKDRLKKIVGDGDKWDILSDVLAPLS